VYFFLVVGLGSEEIAQQGKIFLILRPKTRGNEFKKLAIWGTIFVGTERQQIA